MLVVCRSGPTFAHFDLDAGVALCDIFDAANDFRHFGVGGEGGGLGVVPALRGAASEKEWPVLMSQDGDDGSGRLRVAAVGERGGVPLELGGFGRLRATQTVHFASNALAVCIAQGR